MISKTFLEELLIFSNFLADEAGKITMRYFRNNFDIENKEDFSPVTTADKKTELKIRKLINEKYPTHGILAEEFENKNINSDLLWVIDPIDGTRSFVAGHKDFGTLIALLYKKKPIIGIIDCPAHRERWVGAINKPTRFNGKITKTNSKKATEDCYALTTGLYFENEQFKNGFDKLIKKIKYFRLGGDCYMYGMLSSGLIDIVIEDLLKAHDYMALIPVIEGAGGIVSDKYGNKISLDSDGSIVASCSKTIHDKVIKILK